MSESLLPCPFCGGEAYLQQQPHDAIDTEYFYICRSCAAQGPWRKTPGNALREWNRRAPDPVLAGLIEKLPRYRIDEVTKISALGESYYYEIVESKDGELLKRKDVLAALEAARKGTT